MSNDCRCGECREFDYCMSRREATLQSPPTRNAKEEDCQNCINYNTESGQCGPANRDVDSDDWCPWFLNKYKLKAVLDAAIQGKR
jgi:hypothetical protein